MVIRIFKPYLKKDIIMKRMYYMFVALIVMVPSLVVGQVPQLVEDQQGQLEQDRRYTMYGVMFYNLENLFDTINNNGRNDYEFTPQGAYQWDGIKYWQKQHNMAYAISQMEVKGSPAEGPVIMARMIEVSDGDLEKAKQRLSKLIRDVDKCIGIMSGEEQ